MTADNTVEINRDALETLTDYVNDELKHNMGPEDEELYDATRQAYNALDGEFRAE